MKNEERGFVNGDNSPSELSGSRIKNVIQVLSGKGGVGKSTVSSHLAAGLAARGNRVGLLDADLTGPSIPKIFKKKTSIYQSELGWIPVYVDREKRLGMISIGFLTTDTDNAVIMRGPRKSAMVTRFINDVCWGELDYLIIDTPPGVGEEQMTIAKIFENNQNLYALLVTTPQMISLSDVQRQLPFCNCAKIKVIGIIENMSTFKCPNCSQCSDIFPTGYVSDFAKKNNINYLGFVNLNPSLSDVFGDSNEEFSFCDYLQSQNFILFKDVIEQLESFISQEH